MLTIFTAAVAIFWLVRFVRIVPEIIHEVRETRRVQRETQRILANN